MASAGDAGIRRFRAEILPENKTARHLFGGLAPTTRERMSGGNAVITVDLDDALGGHSGGICATSQTSDSHHHQFGENGRMAIKVIVELRARPGRRDELQSLLENMIAAQGSNQHGFLGSTRYEVLDDADLLVEIADWESAEARMAHMQEAVATGAYKPLLELLAAPFRVTAIRQLF